MSSALLYLRSVYSNDWGDSVEALYSVYGGPVAVIWFWVTQILLKGYMEYSSKEFIEISKPFSIITYSPPRTGELL